MSMRRQNSSRGSSCCASRSVSAVALLTGLFVLSPVVLVPLASFAPVLPLAQLAATPAFAESLNDALASAYRNNPRLNAERARLRGTDEELPRAKSGYRPTITGDADVTYTNRNTDPSSPSDGSNTSKGYGVALNQNLFDGFRTRNAIRSAETTILAGRENVRAVEQAVLLDAVAAYVNVIRDQAIVRLRENNVQVLSRELRATQDRFDVGEVTRTDVAQARARRAGAVSQLDLAKANVRSSIGDFERVVGHKPTGVFEPPTIDGMLPRSIDHALQIGEQENPNIVSAVFLEESASAQINQIKGELLPRVDLQASYDHRYTPSSGIDDVETTTVVGRVTVPLYTGGEVAARIRQAKQNRLGRRDDIEQARAQMRADVTFAWSQLTAARAQLQSDRIQVEASQTALTGVREEEKVGQRTLLDVLDAEQELLNAQVNLVGTKRDLVVAGYAVLNSIGRLSASTLGLSTELYDVEMHTREVEDKWWGISILHEDGYDSLIPLDSTDSPYK